MRQDTVMAADGAHEYLNLFCGFNFPRWWVRQLSQARRDTLCRWATAVLAAASDNIVPKKQLVRPSWVPKKYVYGRKL